MTQHMVSSSQSVAVRCTGWDRTSSLPTCAPDGHILRVTIPDAVSIKFNLMMMNLYCSKHVEECNGPNVK